MEEKIKNGMFLAKGIENAIYKTSAYKIIVNKNKNLSVNLETAVDLHKLNLIDDVISCLNNVKMEYNLKDNNYSVKKDKIEKNGILEPVSNEKNNIIENFKDFKILDTDEKDLKIEKNGIAFYVPNTELVDNKLSSKYLKLFEKVEDINKNLKEYRIVEFTSDNYLFEDLEHNLYNIDQDHVSSNGSLKKSFYAEIKKQKV